MATLQEVKAAEERMKKAYVALKVYVSRPDALQNDMELHRRLAEELRQATNDYTRLVFDLTS
jgi:hypothetical protein